MICIAAGRPASIKMLFAHSASSMVSKESMEIHSSDIQRISASTCKKCQLGQFLLSSQLDSSQLVPACPHLSQLVPTCPNSSRLVPTRPVEGGGVRRDRKPAG